MTRKLCLTRQPLSDHSLALTSRSQIAVGSIQLEEAKIHMAELRGKLHRLYPAAGAVSKIMVAAARLAKSASIPFAFYFDETSKREYMQALEDSG